MAEIILSSTPETKMVLSEGLSSHHENLKNLDYDSSGHTGFQKQLTEGQLKNIEDVTNKENTINKITQLSEDNTHIQYPSAKAVYDALGTHGDFELIESVTLEENVVSVTPAISGKYKELFLLFKIPEAPTVGGTKGRWIVYTKNQYGLLKQCIFNLGASMIPEYTTQDWRTVFHIKLFGDLCKTDMFYNSATVIDGAYAMGFNTSTYSGTAAPVVELFNDYIDALKIDFTSPTDTANENLRYLPAGTSYELWGVRA